MAYTVQDPRPDYFAGTSYGFDWTFNGQSVPMRFWRKPLHAMTDAFTTVGFRLATISEPQPDPAARDLFPDEFHDLSSKTCFLFFVVEVPPSTTGSDDWPVADHERSIDPAFAVPLVEANGAAVFAATGLPVGRLVLRIGDGMLDLVSSEVATS